MIGIGIRKLCGNNGCRQHRAGVAFLPVVIFCLALLVPSMHLNAQVQTGINGTVVDVKGAVIPKANVTVTDNATGIVSRAVTSTAGTFTVIVLNPGHYSVAVEAKGFKQSVQTDVTVEISKFSAVAFTMVPGATSQSVKVTGQEISLNTTDPEIGTTLEPALYQAAPNEINGGPRQISQFELQAVGTSAPTIGAEVGSLVINGGITDVSSYPYYNGIPIEQPVSPPYEMVNEFRVASSTFSAQYGLEQGAITYNMASGTNQLHGDVFDILRNSFFDSDGFFPVNFNAAGKPEPPTNHQNDLGFTVGGPIMISKLYDGRNRTFFLFSLDWYGQRQAQFQFGTVPSTAEKNGDFSNYVDANGNQIPIYDPQTGQPFPGNIIPKNRFSPLSSSILPLIPPKNRTGIVFDQQDNEMPAIPSVTDYTHLWGFSLDHNLTKSQILHFSMFMDMNGAPSVGANIVPFSNPLQSGNSNTNVGSGYVLNYVNNINPNLVVTAGVARMDNNSNGSDATLKGANFAGVISGTAFPNITFDGQNPMSYWGNGTTFVTNRQIGVSFVNNWLWTTGRHTFNIGAELRRAYNDRINCQGCNAEFNFSQRTTSTPNPSDPNFGTYGSSFASFLLGEVDNGFRTYSEEARLRNLDFSPYIEDDYKASNRLTVNAGLRWDVMVPANAVNNNIVFANLSMPNIAAGGLLGAATKYGNCEVGCSGTDRADIHWGNFGPRFGFSYMVNDKTVVQGGYYLAYIRGGAYGFNDSRFAQTYTSLLAGSFTANSTGTSTPGYGDWDTRPMPSPPATPFSPAMGNGNFIHMLDPKKAGIAPYNQSWNANLQRQLPWDMYLTVAYVGNRDIHLPSSLNQPDQLNPAYLALGNLLSQPIGPASAAAVAAAMPGTVINPAGPYPNFINDFGGNAIVQQALLPYPQFSGLSNHFDQSGSSFYNALEAQAEKRFTNGFSYLASLTVSRNMSNVDYGLTIQQNNPENTYDQKLEWAPSSLNQAYATKFVWTYDLPVGKGQKYLNSKGLLAQVLGGWQVAGIMNYWAGHPFGLSQNNVVLMATSASGDGVNRPNVVPGQKRQTYSYNRTMDYFMGKTTAQPVQVNTSAFVKSPHFGLGNAHRNYASMTTMPYRMEDFDAMKYFHITDKIMATLRVDYFNAFNRTQLTPPDNDIDDSTFGMVTSQSSQSSNRQGQATFRIEF